MWRWLIDTASGWSSAAIIIRLLIAFIVGLVVGVDRASKRRGAGIKTHTLVCVGSALVMLTSEYMFRTFPEAKADLARMGAQVISGIGFLGVGTILVTGKNQVKGLTTAAGLWTTACIGLAVGIGFIEGSIYCFILIIFIFKVMSIVDDWMHSRNKVLNFYLEFHNYRDISVFTNEINKKNMKIVDMSIIKGEVNEGIAVTVSVEATEEKSRRTLLSSMQQMDAVKYAEEI